MRVPVAYELALKIKEASYVHAEGFPAGEFRHGSSAMLDASTAIIGISLLLPIVSTPGSTVLNVGAAATARVRGD